MLSNNISDYFELSEKDNCVFFIGDKAECLIPQRYLDKEFLIMDSKLSVLAVFSIIVDDHLLGGILIPSMITMDPVNTETRTIDDTQYIVATLHKGSQFICNLDLVMVDRTGYDIWLELISLGNMPAFIDYNDTAFIFDDMKEFTGKKIGADHAILEIIMAHMHRDPHDLTVPYRATAMTERPAQITLRDIGIGTSATHSRLIGAYADIGRTAALLNQSDENHELEDYFRM